MNTRTFFSFLITGTLLLVPVVTSAATAKFEVTGWMPYWRGATSTNDVLPHINDMTEVNPFVYTIKSNGTLLDNGNLSAEPWASFINTAKADKVRVIPTIMTSDGTLLHTLINTKAHRDSFASNIVQTVNAGGFDGIDIDFEGKHAEDKDNFSLFLQNLYQRMGSKWVMCTIEARTPLADRYAGTDIPPDASIYSNDFAKINKYCDRVRIMTYDQQGVDLTLSNKAASSSLLYAPIADPAWVEKVVNLTAQQVSRNKILIGIPTYGYEYEVTVYANNQYMYDILWTFNPGYATQIALQYGITPTRNSAGEMNFTYVSNDNAPPATSVIPNSALLASAAASMYATQYNSHLSFRMIDWPDAQTVQDKINLAKKLGVRGISIFKLDGGEDQGLWTVLDNNKK
jgi:spore germination protein